MEKVILQVHYCGSEESLNNFLKIINVDGETYPKLHSITYVPKAEGSGNNENYQVNGSVVAVVQYFTKREVE